MSLKSYLIIIAFTSLLCWLAFMTVIYIINPDTTNWLGFSLFYISLFLAISSTTTIVGFLVRFIGLKRDFIDHSVKAAFRQSFLFALLVIISGILLAHDLFTWLNVLLLIIGLSVLEYFLLSYSKLYPQADSNNSSQSEEGLCNNLEEDADNKNLDI